MLRYWSALLERASLAKSQVCGDAAVCCILLPSFKFLWYALTCVLAAGHEQAKDRDPATAAASALCVSRGANIVRVHNVAAVRDAVRVADAVNRYSEGVIA